MAARLGLGLGLLLLAAGCVAGAQASSGYTRRRAQWAEESARLRAGDPAYTARRSDRLYEEMSRRRVAAKRAGGLAGLGALLAALAWRPRRRGGVSIARLRAVWRAHVAALADGVVLCSLGLLALQIEPWLSPERAGLGVFLGRLALGTTLALGWGGVAAGVTIGGRLTGTRIVRADAPPGVGLGLAAFSLSIVAWPRSLLALVFRVPRGPLHLLWTGLETVAAEPAHTTASPGAQI